MKLKYISEDISWKIMDMDRTVAIILMDGKIYSSGLNHQCCLEDVITDIFQSRGWDINTDEGLEKAIDYTDSAFRENRIFGFDIYSDLENEYLIAHYPQNLENEECYRIIKEYAEANEYQLGTYTRRNSLGNKVKLVC